MPLCMCHELNGSVVQQNSVSFFFIQSIKELIKFKKQCTYLSVSACDLQLRSARDAKFSITFRLRAAGSEYGDYSPWATTNRSQIRTSADEIFLDVCVCVWVGGEV